MNSSLKFQLGKLFPEGEAQVRQPIASFSLSAAPILAGATCYYQYDRAIGSTPRSCVVIFSLGAAGSNVPVRHNVFPSERALESAKEKHDMT